MTKFLPNSDSKTKNLDDYATYFARRQRIVAGANDSEPRPPQAPLSWGSLSQTKATALFGYYGASRAGRLRINGESFSPISDYPTHYTAPEFFLEPAFRSKNPFAVLSTAGDKVTGVLTGINERGHVQSGLSVRPQIALSHSAGPVRGLRKTCWRALSQRQDAPGSSIFSRGPNTAGSIDARFRQKQCEGVIMLDLSRGPDALFRKFSENKRTNIKKAIKFGVSVEPAKHAEDISAYYAICSDWSRRKGLPIPPEEEFEQNFALINNRALFLARHEGKIIAGVVIRFFPHGIMEYAANSSLESALRFRPNDLLHWRAIEWGCMRA